VPCCNYLSTLKNFKTPSADRGAEGENILQKNKKNGRKKRPFGWFLAFY
jgi:hypothetical protein